MQVAGIRGMVLKEGYKTYSFTQRAMETLNAISTKGFVPLEIPFKMIEISNELEELKDETYSLSIRRADFKDKINENNQKLPRIWGVITIYDKESLYPLGEVVEILNARNLGYKSNRSYLKSKETIFNEGMFAYYVEKEIGDIKIRCVFEKMTKMLILMQHKDVMFQETGIREKRGKKRIASKRIKTMINIRPELYTYLKKKIKEGKNVRYTHIFDVQGHWRNYKNGKRVWVKNYKKGEGEYINKKRIIEGGPTK